jgi:5'(3')-deoxyribonucleotidase
VSKIHIDVDQVVADMIGDLFERMGGGLRPGDFPNWKVFEDMSEGQRGHAYSIMSRSEFWANLPLMDGALKAVKHLKDFGHEVIWVTAPWKCRGWETARRAWIKHHFGNDKVIVSADKEKSVKSGVFIDDKPDNIDDVQRANPDVKCFIFDTPHNRKYTGAPRFTWADVGKLT